jgi:hypothetical protein
MERRSSLEKNEAAFDPLSAMLMEEEEKKEQPAAPTDKRFSGFDVADLEKDLGVSSSSRSSSKANTTPARLGARSVSVGEDVMSPAPIAVPAPEADDTNDDEIAGFVTTAAATTTAQQQSVLEDPFDNVPKATTPFITGATRKDTSDSMSSELASSTVGFDDGPFAEANKKEQDESSVAMRVSNLDVDTITRIRRESQCNIVVSAAPSGGNSKEQSVTISGTSENVRTAQKLIRKHVASTEYTPLKRKLDFVLFIYFFIYLIYRTVATTSH